MIRRNRMEEYKEHEIKVLDVNIEEVSKKLEEIGANKVYDDNRIITTFDTDDSWLKKQDKLVRITEEDGTKVTMHVNNSNPETKEVIKYKISRKKEQQDFFLQLGIKPIAKVQAYRKSYELGTIDFDIDKFPAIPAFLEIDVKGLNSKQVKELIEKLEISNNKIVILGTEQIHDLYGVDYFKEYRYV